MLSTCAPRITRGIGGNFANPQRNLREASHPGELRLRTTPPETSQGVVRLPLWILDQNQSTSFLDSAQAEGLLRAQPEAESRQNPVLAWEYHACISIEAGKRLEETKHNHKEYPQ